MSSEYGAAMVPHYLEAIAFADTGDEGQPEAGAEFSSEAIARATDDCIRFAREYSDTVSEYEPQQVAHDLWFSRNGHGVGFWEGESRGYIEADAVALQAGAEAMGECYVTENDCGEIELD
jgi:hypothetical protein